MSIFTINDKVINPYGHIGTVKGVDPDNNKVWVKYDYADRGYGISPADELALFETFLRNGTDRYIVLYQDGTVASVVSLERTRQDQNWPNGKAGILKINGTTGDVVWVWRHDQLKDTR